MHDFTAMSYLLGSIFSQFYLLFVQKTLEIDNTFLSRASVQIITHLFTSQLAGELSSYHFKNLVFNSRKIHNIKNIKLLLLMTAIDLACDQLTVCKLFEFTCQAKWSLYVCTSPASKKISFACLVDCLLCFILVLVKSNFIIIVDKFEGWQLSLYLGLAELTLIKIMLRHG